MVIYAEYLFIENFITGLIILILTSKLCGTEVKKRRYFLGSLACGLFSFVIFLNMNWVAALLSKLFFSALLVTLVFYKIKLKQFFKITLNFYIVSFAMGGITIGLMYFVGAKGVSNNSFIYLEHITYFNVLAGATLTYILISRLARFIKDRVLATGVRAEVSVFLLEKEIKLKGLVDTGNFLTEPISGFPVMVLSLSAAMEYLPQELIDKWIMFREYKKGVNGLWEGIRLIPFQSVGEENGLMMAFKPEKMEIRDGNKIRNLHNVYIAINEKNFKHDQGEHCAILLHRDILDKGIVCYD